MHRQPHRLPAPETRPPPSTLTRNLPSLFCTRPPDWFLKMMLSPCCSFAPKSTQHITQHLLSTYMLDLLISYSSSCQLNTKVSISCAGDWLAAPSACNHFRPGAQPDYTAQPSLAVGCGHWNVGWNYVHCFHIWSMKTCPTQSSMLSSFVITTQDMCWRWHDPRPLNCCLKDSPIRDTYFGLYISKKEISVVLRHRDFRFNS